MPTSYACLPAVGQAAVKVYSPWVLSEHTADMRDEARFAADPRWAKLEGQEKALAAWRYLTDRETGTWHYSDMYEGANPSRAASPHELPGSPRGGDLYWESKLVKDPTKLLNVYGFGVCTMHACLIEGLYEAMGFGVRQMEFGGYHRTAEVEWDGAHHYLDVDERAYLVDEAGRVVSVTEATSRPELWKLSAEQVHPFYPQNGGIRGIQELSKHGPPVAHWHWRTLGHSMDFTLRPGESVTRYWQGQGKWRMCEAWNSEGTLESLLEDPAGPKTSSELSANNSYGNGMWVYEPKLGSMYADFYEGVYRWENIRQDARGLTLDSPGTGWVEWRVRTPYIIVGEPHDLTTTADDTGAAVVEGSCVGAVGVSVSTDQGRHWERVGGSRGGEERLRVDLTRWVAGCYEYHVRFDLSGKPGESRLETLRLTTWTQVAPMSLPRLRAGINHLQLALADKYGCDTEVLSIEPEFSDPADMERWGVEVEGDYDPHDRTARARGPVTMRVEALAGTEVRWLHIGGSFNARREDGRAGARAPGQQPDRILYALDAKGPWQLLREETPPEWDQHWYYNMETELMLDQPAKTVWVRLEPATAANGLRVYAHCAPSAAGEEMQRLEVVVTHAWRIEGQPVTRTFRFGGPEQYQIECDGEPENLYLQMAVPSRLRGR